jgi:hypothetical protein
VTTDKAASCRYGALPFLSWAVLTPYAGTTGSGPYTHSTLSSVAAGRTYQICSRCLDTLANQYSGDACTRFSVRPYRQQDW